DVHDRRLVARLCPERLRTAEQEAAVTDDGDHGLIGTRKLYAKAGCQAPSEHVWSGAEIFLVGAAERHGLFHQSAGIDIANEAGVLVESRFELEPDPLERDRRAVGVLLDDLVAEGAHIPGMGAGPGEALLRDLLELLRRCHALDGSNQIRNAQPQIAD